MIRIGTLRSNKFGRMANVSFKFLHAKPADWWLVMVALVELYQIPYQPPEDAMTVWALGSLAGVTLLIPVGQAMDTRSAVLEACARFIDGGSPAQYHKYTRSL